MLSQLYKLLTDLCFSSETILSHTDKICKGHERYVPTCNRKILDENKKIHNANI